MRRLLGERLSALGLEPDIHIVGTAPTASLPERAARLAEAIDATAQRGGAPLHLIGHSSGGLDARLLTAPGVTLPTALDVERLAARVRTVVTVTTPHHGTPLASFFTTLPGQQLLQLVALNTIYVLNFGHLPLAAMPASEARSSPQAPACPPLRDVAERPLPDLSRRNRAYSSYPPSYPRQGSRGRATGWQQRTGDGDP